MGSSAADDAWIHLFGAQRHRAASDSTTALRVGVQGIDELYGECRVARGSCMPNAALHEEPWGFKEFSVIDLDGNLVTFFEPPEGHDPREDET